MSASDDEGGWFRELLKKAGEALDALTARDAAAAGARCPYCDEPILAEEPAQIVGHFDENGPSLRPWHRECFARSAGGGVLCIMGRCRGACGCDPPGMTMREGARAAWELRQAMASGRMQRKGDA